MRSGLCSKRTSTLTAIDYCAVDRQLLIALHQSSICDFCRATCIRRPRWGVPLRILP